MAGDEPHLFVCDYGNHRVVALHPETLRFRFSFGRPNEKYGPHHVKMIGPSCAACKEHQLFVGCCNGKILQFDMSQTGHRTIQHCGPAIRAFCMQAVGPRLLRTISEYSNITSLTIANGRLYVMNGKEVCTFRLSDPRVANVLSLSRGVKSELAVYDGTAKWPLTSDNRYITFTENDIGKCIFADPDTWQVYAVVAGKLAVLK